MPFRPPSSLRRLACIGISFLAISTACAQSGLGPEKVAAPRVLSPVILAERPGAVHDLTADPAQARRLLDAALLKLTSAPDLATAWTRLGITPRDIVGIKIATDGGKGLSTHHSLVQAICEGLHAAGVPSAQIIIWDKFGNKMRLAGYAPRAASGNLPAIASVVAGNYYDPNVYYKNEIVGNLMWGDSQFMNSVSGGVSSNVLNRSYYARYLTDACTKLINVPVLTDNRFVGLNGCLATLALGSVDNNRRFQGPSTYGDPAIDEILDQTFIRRKVVVNILDALVAQCAGGPAFDPQFCAGLGAIYVSRDPVAIDYLALPRLERMRASMNVPPIGHTADHIRGAVAYNLGTTDPRRIQLVKLQ